MEIIITNNDIKKSILNKLNQEKKLCNYKFYTFRKLKKELFFDYDNKTIEYIMKKYNTNINIAKVFLENMYFLKDIKDDNTIFLSNLKKELEENKLLIINKYFKDYLKKNKCRVIINSYLSNEEKLILEGIDYEIENINNNKYTPKVYETKNIDKEVEFVTQEICKLIDKGISLNKIKIIYNEEYTFYIEYYFNLFKIPFNHESTSTMYSLGLTKEFLSNYDNLSIEENINNLKEKYNVIDLIKVINKSADILDKDIRKYFIIDDLKNTKLKNNTYDYAVSKASLDDYFTDEDYIFLLGFNLNDYPKIKKDEDYFTDEVKNILKLDTSLELNKLAEDDILNKITSLKNLVITYKLHDFKTNCYPSTILDNLDVKINKASFDYKISYSSSYSNLLYAIDLDNLYKYNEVSSNLALWQNNLNIKYREYNNSYDFIDIALYHEQIDNNIKLSYTSLEEYFECGFKYYLSRVLNLNIYENNFKTIIGNITHYILQNFLSNNLNIHEEIKKYVTLNEYKLSKKEYFYLSILEDELKIVLDYLKESEGICSLNDYLFEQNISIIKYYDDFILELTGFIDKVMKAKYKNKDVIALIDYKTGSKSISLDTLKYGLNIQLPIYLYLLKKSFEYKDSFIAGFYFEEVLNKVLDKDINKGILQRKKDNLKLKGYSNSEENILRLLDKNYENSTYIKGLKVKSDHTLAKSAKVLSNEEMDEIIETVDKLIDEASKNIYEAKFNINPKIYKNINQSCTYCKYKDICYIKKKDEVILKEEE